MVVYLMGDSLVSFASRTSCWLVSRWMVQTTPGSPTSARAKKKRFRWQRVSTDLVCWDAERGHPTAATAVLPHTQL